MKLADDFIDSLDRLLPLDRECVSRRTLVYAATRDLLAELRARYYFDADNAGYIAEQCRAIVRDEDELLRSVAELEAGEQLKPQTEAA